MWCKRRPWRAGLAAALIFAVLAGGIGVVSQWRRAEEASLRAEAGRLLAEQNAYAAQISLAQALTTQGQFEEARQTLLDAGPESLRGWEWGWLMRECNQDLMTLGLEDHGLSDCAFSPDGGFVVTGGKDGALRIWNLKSGSRPQIVRDDDDSAIDSLTVSPDGKTAATTHAEGPAKVWDLEGETLPYTLGDSSDGITCAAFSPDGETIATGTVNGRVQFWAGDSSSLIREVARYEDGAVRAIAFSPDGGQLAYIGGSYDPTNQTPTTLCILDLETGLLRQLAGHKSSVLALAFSPDGEWVATAGRDGTNRITRSHGDAPLRIIHSVSHGLELYALAFSPNSRQLIVAGGRKSDGLIHVIDLGSEDMTVRQARQPEVFRSVNYSPDGRVFAAASADGTISLMATQPQPAFINLEGHDGDVWAVDVSPDGQYIASGSLDQTAKIWEMKTGRLVNTIPVHFPVVAVAFTADSRHLVTNAHGDTARVWPVEGGEATLQLSGHGALVRSVATDPMGLWIATGSRDQKARLWDAATGELLRTFSAHVQSVTSLAFSPDGERLATASLDRHAIVWELETGRRRCEITGIDRVVTRILFSPDGRTVATSSFDDYARIWDADTGDLIGLPFKSPIFGMRNLAFSPDGKRLLTTGADTQASGSTDVNKAVTLWDVASGRRILEFHPHNAGTYAMAFSPDGTRIITGGGNNPFESGLLFHGALRIIPEPRIPRRPYDWRFSSADSGPTRSSKRHHRNESSRCGNGAKRTCHAPSKSRPPLPCPYRRGLPLSAANRSTSPASTTPP